jgi:hypothetical protein
MAVDIETVCTDADLLSRVGEERLKRFVPAEASRDAARAQSLREVLSGLSGRSPAVSESDLSDHTELREPVMLRALQILFENAAASPEGLQAWLANKYGKEYASVSTRSYTLATGIRGPSGGSFRMERR